MWDIFKRFFKNKVEAEVERVEKRAIESLTETAEKARKALELAERERWTKKWSRAQGRYSRLCDKRQRWLANGTSLTAPAEFAELEMAITDWFKLMEKAQRMLDNG